MLAWQQLTWTGKMSPVSGTDSGVTFPSRVHHPQTHFDVRWWSSRQSDSHHDQSETELLGHHDHHAPGAQHHGRGQHQDQEAGRDGGGSVVSCHELP